MVCFRCLIFFVREDWLMVDGLWIRICVVKFIFWIRVFVLLRFVDRCVVVLLVISVLVFVVIR